MARIYSNFSYCSKKSSTSPLYPSISVIGQKQNSLNYFKRLPLKVPSFVFRHISCCKITEIQSQSIKAKLPAPTGHAPVTGKSAGCPALPACGRQVGGEESRPYNHIYITRKPQPCLSRLNGMGGKLPFPYGYTKIYYGIDANTCGR
jgi:hypothetical protein